MLAIVERCAGTGGALTWTTLSDMPEHMVAHLLYAEVRVSILRHVLQVCQGRANSAGSIPGWKRAGVVMESSRLLGSRQNASQWGR